MTYWSFTINEFGDTTGSCANVGAEINAGSIANTMLDGATVASGATQTWSQAGFAVPLKSILGNSIVVSTGVASGAASVVDCCVLGKAQAAVVPPDQQTMDHTNAYHTQHQAQHAANLPHAHPHQAHPQPHQPHAPHAPHGAHPHGGHAHGGHAHGGHAQGGFHHNPYAHGKAFY